MGNRKPDARSAELNRLVEKAQGRRMQVSAAATPRGKALARILAFGPAVALKAFVNATDPGLLREAANAAARVLDTMDAAFSNGKWAGAFNLLGDLTAALQDFAGAAGIPFASKDGSPSPARLLAALESGIRDEDVDATSAAIGAVREALDVTALPINPASSPPATATRATTAGTAVFVQEQRVLLSASEVEACAAAGARLEDFAANRLIRDRARAGRAAR